MIDVDENTIDKNNIEKTYENNENILNGNTDAAKKD